MRGQFPTAALTAKNTEVPLYEVETTCPYCGVGCGMYLGVRSGKVVSVRGSGSKANKSRLCVKGRFGISGYVHSRERLKTPLIKKNGRFVEEAGTRPCLWLQISLHLTRRSRSG